MCSLFCLLLARSWEWRSCDRWPTVSDKKRDSEESSSHRVDMLEKCCIIFTSPPPPPPKRDLNNALRNKKILKGSGQGRPRLCFAQILVFFVIPSLSYPNPISPEKNWHISAPIFPLQAPLIIALRRITTQSKSALAEIQSLRYPGFLLFNLFRNILDWLTILSSRHCN